MSIEVRIPTILRTYTNGEKSVQGVGATLSELIDDLEANHPVIQPTRHADYYRLNARNRVWLARRNLPALFVPLYVGSWTGIQILRWARNRSALSAWFGGWREGWREYPGVRRPLSGRTIWRMTLAGRPPIV